jgi:hypothetical protein
MLSKVCPFLLKENKIMNSRFWRHMEDKTRARGRREDEKRAMAESPFLEPAPPLLVILQEDLGKLPAGISIQFPHDVAIRLLHLNLGIAVPVGNFDARPDLVVDEDQLQHASLPVELLSLETVTA